jgi:hypothetical protein
MPKPFVPAKPSCGTCSAWTRSQPLQPTGVCRANPPTVIGYGAVQGPGGRPQPLLGFYWPATGDTDYCRDGYRQRLPEDLPEIDISKIAVDTIEGTA